LTVNVAQRTYSDVLARVRHHDLTGFIGMLEFHMVAFPSHANPALFAQPVVKRKNIGERIF
jgi:hypothetical protein